jgi:arylsulfatase A-like enzyme
MLLVLACTVGHSASANAQAQDRPNVLFMAVDDLKPILGAYGNETVHTPHIDELASRGTGFTNAHCQQAVCAPSRVSLMTGLRPDATKVWDLRTAFRQTIPDVVTLPQYFKQQGYTSVGIGKTYDPRSAGGRRNMDKVSWSRDHLNPSAPAQKTMGYRDPEVAAYIKKRTKLAREKGITGWRARKEFIGLRAATDSAEVPDEAYKDGAIANTAIKQLRQLSGRAKPFFLAVGFKKPHLPFNAPQKYWDLYERDQFSVAQVKDMPKGAPQFHYQDSWELRNNYTDVPKAHPLPRAYQKQLIHGYYACVSYIDAQVGRVIGQLRQSGELDNTLIMLWGDHGWHLGDHGMWCKHTNYEQAARSPLIMVDPSIENPTAKTHAPVELLDMYPTLTDMAGLPTPDALHGVSLQPLMTGEKQTVKPVAISQFHRNNQGEVVMGYSVRDQRYRYTEWRVAGEEKGPGTGEVVARELYDYKLAPNEPRNLIDEPNYQSVARRLARALQQQRVIEPNQ